MDLRRAGSVISISGLLLSAVASPAVGQEIRGVVRARGVGIGVGGADVKLIAADSTLTAEKQSDDIGGFVFKDVNPGPYTIRVAAPGFARAAETQILVRQGDVLDATVWLDPQPITIPKLQVEARRRGEAFIEQQTGLRVRSLNPDDIALGAGLERAKVGSYNLTDVMHKEAFPGLLVLTQMPGGPCFQIKGAVGPDGQPVCAEVYLDGLRVDRNRLWSVEVENIGAIVTLDANDAGVLYGTGSWGGVVLVYTLDAMGRRGQGGGDMRRPGHQRR